MLDLSLFASRSFSVANAATLLYAMGFFAMLLGNILFLTSVWHYSILKAGLAVTPGPLVVAVVSGPAGKLAGRVGFRPVLLAGFAVFVSGLGWYARRWPEPDYLAVWLPGTLSSASGSASPSRCSARRPSPASTRPVSPSAAPSTRPPARSAAPSAWRPWW